jgi:hypothetical protein
MGLLTADSLLRFASGLEGERLTTMARGAAFTLRVLPVGIEITPESSGEARLVPREKVGRVCAEFQRLRSTKPGDYQAITFDASYLLAVIDLYERDAGGFLADTYAVGRKRVPEARTAGGGASFGLLRGLAMRPTVYVCFTPDRLSMRVAGTGRQVEDVPLLAIEAVTQRIHAIGSDAREVSRPHVELCNPFQSDRTLVGDVDAAGVMLLYHLTILLPPRWGIRIRKPDLLLHPLHVRPGGVTTFELQGLVELGRVIGGRRVEVYLGEPLTDDRILAHRYEPARSYPVTTSPPRGARG